MADGDIEFTKSFNYFTDSDHRFSVPKTRRRVALILEAAIHCYLISGFESVTFKMIARESGITSSSLRHYFKNLKEVQELTIRYVYYIFQKEVLDGLEKDLDPDKILLRFIVAHLSWANNHPKHINFWNSFAVYSYKSETEKKLFSALLTRHLIYIESLLSRGRRIDLFRHKNDSEKALVIQTILVGWMMLMPQTKTENSSDYSTIVFNECMSLVKNPK